MDNSVFDCKSGKYNLRRIPHTKTGSLRAWDAADELLIDWVFENLSDALAQLNTSNQPILLTNDAFGALAASLHDYKCQSWSDSYISKLATQQNFEFNKLDNNPEFIGSTEALKNSYPLVLIKVPKTLALLEDQLCRLKPHLLADSIVITAGMSKHIHTSALKLFEKIIGTTQTSRAIKKARLIFSKNDSKQVCALPYPNIVKDKSFELTLKNHANVFSQKQLDIGTCFFINQLVHLPDADLIMDLGCGNGALGIMAQRKNPKAKLIFLDESYAAIASAKKNYASNIQQTETEAEFILSHCLDQFIGNSPDLILCNPPFHQAHSVGDQIAWQMFKQSLDVLNKDGEFWVIGNRHLGYHSKMKKLFGNCRTIAANKKFVVLASTKH